MAKSKSENQAKKQAGGSGSNKIPKPPKTDNEALSTPNEKKPIWAFVLLFGSPILLIVSLWFLIKLPQILANPKYDFVYSVCDYSRCKEYDVDDNGKIVSYSNKENSLVIADGQSYNLDDVIDNTDTLSSKSLKYPNLYRYNQADGKSTKISADEYNKYTIDTSNTSPDGYELKEADYSTRTYMFGGSSYEYSWTLSKGIASKPVRLIGKRTSYYYNDDAKFIGWVKNGN